MNDKILLLLQHSPSIKRLPQLYYFSATRCSQFLGCIKLASLFIKEYICGKVITLEDH